MHEYLQGANRLDAGCIIRPGTWDPSLVLHALERSPFEPLDQVDMKWASFKLAALLLLTTAARYNQLI